MLVPKDIYNKIDDIIEHSYNGFIYNLIGDEFLTLEQRTMMESLGLLTRRKTLLELLYILVRQRSEKRYQSRRELKKLLDSVFETGVFDHLPRTHQMIIDNAQQSMSNIIEQTKADVKKRIKHEIVKINKEYVDLEPTEVITVPSEVQEPKEGNLGKIMLAVGAALLLSKKLFYKEFTGELTDLVNKASGATALESLTGKDTLVYKLVVNDSHLCQYCYKSYMNEDGTPKLYKIATLQKNGSNDGLPRHQWKPVVGPHHKYCRCQLHIYKNSLD